MEINDNNDKSINLEKSLVDDLFFFITRKDHKRIMEIPKEWDFYRSYDNLIGTFFVIKKIFITKVWNDSKSHFTDPSLTERRKEVLLSRNIVIDLIKTPFVCPEDRKQEERIRWMQRVKTDLIYEERKEYFEMRGDVYIVDYDLNKILEKVEEIG